jgi:serine phosphatase RsbU (regulator of sigma subunit)/pSer/pThr/pTyr-binding forkhead associated (FHA) protein
MGGRLVPCIIKDAMTTLYIVPAEGEAFEHELQGDSLVIGRSSRCDLAVADRCLSRQHVRIFRSGSEWLVEDMGSRNGTRVNGSMISGPTPIAPGDVIDASMSRIAFGGSGGKQPQRISHAESHTIYRDASEIISESEREFARPAESGIEDLRQAADQLKVLYDVHHTLDEATTAEELLDHVLERVFVHLRPQHGAIFLKHEDDVVIATSRSQVAGTDEFPESKSLASEVIGKGLAAVVHDTTTDDRFAAAESLLDAGVRTLVAAPLLTPEGAIGMIVLSSTLATRLFGASDMELLTVVASATGLRLRNLALAEEAAERKRFEQEVALARRIQVALLPAENPEVPGLEIHGGNIPSRGVSGDYYQVVERPDTNEVAVIIADVSGKGIGASLLTAYVDALVNAYLGENLEPAEIFNRVSPQMNAKTPVESFATAFLGIFSLDTGTLRYASAGHDPTLLVRAEGDVELLMPTGMPLGLMPEAVYSSSETSLAVGDSLVLYTDGITEAANPIQEEFGRERLVEVCEKHRSESPKNLATSIEKVVDAFVDGVPYHDDRTLVILRRS